MLEDLFVAMCDQTWEMVQGSRIWPGTNEAMAGFHCPGRRAWPGSLACRTEPPRPQLSRPNLKKLVFSRLVL